MATVEFYQAYNMANPTIFYGTVTSATSTQIVINDYAGNIAVYFGYGLTYSGSSVTGGTITAFDRYRDNSIAGTVREVSIDARTLVNLVNSGNPARVESFVLSGIDAIIGSEFSDGLLGYSRDDFIVGQGGNDYIDGGDGTDTAYFLNPLSAHRISFESGRVIITGSQGTDTLVSVEKFNFAGITYTLSELTPTYRLVSNQTSINEGSTASFTLSTTNVASGTSVPYTLTGISAADVSGGLLSGNAVVNSSGVATISVTLLNDSRTEGAETLTVNAGSATASTVVNDTSRAVATYSLSPDSSSVNEGSTATFTLRTTGVTAGESVPYTLTGISVADVSNASVTLSGNTIVNSSGVATISVILLNDTRTEGAETLTVSAGGSNASITINDTSIDLVDTRTTVDDVLTPQNFIQKKIELLASLKYNNPFSPPTTIEKNQDESGAWGHYGTKSRDDLVGTDLVDFMFGHMGNDNISGGKGNDFIYPGGDGGFGDGGEGIDTLVLDRPQSSYTYYPKFITANGINIDISPTFVTKANLPLESNTFDSIERVKFSDTNLALDLGSSENAGITAKVLGAVFGKGSLSNKTYVGIGLNLLDSGTTYENLLALALDAAGAKTKDQIVSLLWKNILGTTASTDDKASYIALLDNGMTAGALAKMTADTSFNAANINLVGLAQTGIEFTPF